MTRPDCKRKRQRGQAHVEYVVIGLALLVVWQGLDLVMDLFSEHQYEYTSSMSQPDF